jgi:hypothetical protein
VASSHEARAFVTLNEFEVFAEDAMSIGSGQETTEVVGNPWMNLILIALAAVIILLIGVSFFAVRKWAKRKYTT